MGFIGFLFGLFFFIWLRRFGGLRVSSASCVIAGFASTAAQRMRCSGPCRHRPLPPSMGFPTSICIQVPIADRGRINIQGRWPPLLKARRGPSRLKVQTLQWVRGQFLSLRPRFKCQHRLLPENLWTSQPRRVRPPRLRLRRARTATSSPTERVTIDYNRPLRSTSNLRQRTQCRRHQQQRQQQLLPQRPPSTSQRSRQPSSTNYGGALLSPV